MERLRSVLPCTIYLLLAVTSGAAGQDNCPDTPHPGSESVTPFVSRSGNDCAAGSYLRSSVSYNANFRTEVSGTCDVIIWDPAIPGCRYDSTTNRGIGASTINENGVAGSVIVYLNPNNFPAIIDTRLSGTSAPDTPTWTFNTQGENRQLRFQSNILATSCSLLNSVQTTIGFTVVACVPEFLRTNQGQIVHNQPTNPITVVVPTSMNTRMKTAIHNAVDRWNDALNSYGTSAGPRYAYSETSTPCTTGPTCVNTQTGSMDLTKMCAVGNHTVDSVTGEVLAGQITFPPESSGWSQAFDDRVAAHELGHLLGLDENISSWSAANSLMKPVVCGASSGYPTGPTLSDHMPVVRTTYQGESSATCQ